jgi:flagellar basal body-associated protein FliL
MIIIIIIIIIVVVVVVIIVIIIVFLLHPREIAAGPSPSAGTQRKSGHQLARISDGAAATRSADY